MIYFSQDAYKAKKKCFVEPFIHKSIHAHKNKFGLCLSSVSITVYLFSPKSLQGEMPFFFFCPNLCRIPPPSQAHSFTLTQPSVVWVPAYMIVIPDLTALGLEPQRQSEKGQRCQRAQSHSLSASLLPIPLSLTLSLGHVLPHHPQNHFFSISRPSFPPCPLQAQWLGDE